MQTDFDQILNKIKTLIDENPDHVLLKICEELQQSVFHYDWVGFYLLKNGKLQLGPFVGKPTEHTEIAIGKGVCGQVAANKKPMVVQDVSQQDNYIACSIDVQSEIVVPILKNNEFIAEIDIDSHSAAPFTPKDTEFLEAIAQMIVHLF